MLQKIGSIFKRLTPMLVGAITIAPLNPVLSQSTISSTIPRPDNLIYQSDSSAFEGTTWQLSAWQSNGRSIQLLPNYPITIRFDGKRLGGSTGCNDYSIDYQFQNSRLRLPGAITSTTKGCIPAVAQRESWFASALKASGSVAFLKRDRLQIEYKAASGKGFLVFTPLRSPLQNTSWKLNSIAIGSTTQSAEHLPISLTFAKDSIGGLAGCNEYSASYQEPPNRLRIGGIATTEKMCSPSQMQHERGFLAKLAAVQRYEVINQGQHLNLFFQQGNQSGVLKFRLPDD